ncbi:MAG TPA: NAD(P)-dependent oxidoreductase [Euzebyales bacterium]
MRIFIAGATGVLGRRVVPALVGRHHTVTAVARGPARAASLRAQGAEPIAVDLFDATAVATTVEGHDAVVNLATAIPPPSRMARRSAWHTTDRLRTEAAGNLVDGALATGAARYVQEALAFVYPDRGTEWIDERAPLDPPSFAAASAVAEAHAARFGEGGGTGIALRFGAFYAADSAQIALLVRTLRRGLLALPEPAGGHRPWVHVDDAAAAVVAALEAPAGVYNVVEDDPLTGAAHLDVLREVFGRRVHGLPGWLAVGPQLRLVMRSQRVSNRRLRGATRWRPTFDRRAGWLQVLDRVATVPDHA